MSIEIPFYKILVVGDMSVGKSSFIRQYVHGSFSGNYKATVGVDFALKDLQIKIGESVRTVRLQLWDIAGQERYTKMTRAYYKDAVGAFIVYDKSRRATFDNVRNWKTDIDQKIALPNGEKLPVVLLANKCDLQDADFKQTALEINQFSLEHGFAGFFETSAKENIKVNEAGQYLFEQIEARLPQQAVGANDNNLLANRSSGGCAC